MFGLRPLSQLLALIVVFAAPFAAGQEPQEDDPWEGYNRAMFQFNDTVDRAVVKPVAQGYQAVMPDIAEQGVNNFFGNLGDVVTLVNNLLQGKPGPATQDFARVVFNSTVGVGGLFDVATTMGIPKHDEDFGQTLGVWGVESGPYLVLPLLGPSTVRDGIGLVPDMNLDPLQGIGAKDGRTALRVLRVVDKRAELLKAESVVTGDRYAFIRDAYLQRREFEVNDGVMPFNADDF